jgi:hypothetical protein
MYAHFALTHSGLFGHHPIHEQDQANDQYCRTRHANRYNMEGIHPSHISGRLAAVPDADKRPSHHFQGAPK